MELQRPSDAPVAERGGDAAAEVPSEYAARRIVSRDRDETAFGGAAIPAEAAVSSLGFETPARPTYRALEGAGSGPTPSLTGMSGMVVGPATTGAGAPEPDDRGVRTTGVGRPPDEPPEPSGRINFGHAYVEALDPWALPFRSDPRFDYYILGVPFTIERPPSFREFRSVEVHFEFETPEATAHGLAPDQSALVDAAGQRTVSDKYWLAPDLSLSTGAVSLGGAEKVVTFTTPVTAVRAMNHYRPDPYWIYERPGGVEHGSRWAVMVVSTAGEADSLSGDASAMAEFWPFGGDASGRLPFDLSLPDAGVRIDPFLSRRPPAS